MFHSSLICRTLTPACEYGISAVRLASSAGLHVPAASARRKLLAAEPDSGSVWKLSATPSRRWNVTTSVPMSSRPAARRQLGHV